MKIKLGDAVDSVEALAIMMRDFAFPTRVSYDLTKTLKSLREEGKAYDELITELQKRFAVKNSGGKDVLDPTRIGDYLKEVDELRGKEVDIWGKTPITLTELENYIRKARKQIRPDETDFEPMIVPAILAPLHWLIVEDEIDTAITDAGIECTKQ